MYRVPIWASREADRNPGVDYSCPTFAAISCRTEQPEVNKKGAGNKNEFYHFFVEVKCLTKSEVSITSDTEFSCECLSHLGGIYQIIQIKNKQFTFGHLFVRSCSIASRSIPLAVNPKSSRFVTGILISSFFK